MEGDSDDTDRTPVSPDWFRLCPYVSGGDTTLWRGDTEGEICAGPSHGESFGLEAVGSAMDSCAILGTDGARRRLALLPEMPVTPLSSRNELCSLTKVISASSWRLAWSLSCMVPSPSASVSVAAAARRISLYWSNPDISNGAIMIASPNKLTRAHRTPFLLTWGLVVQCNTQCRQGVLDNDGHKSHGRRLQAQSK